MRRIAPWLLAGLCALAIAWWWAQASAPANVALPPALPTAPAPSPEAPGAQVVPKPRPASSAKDARCARHASEGCYQGDVWSLDGCGYLEEKVEECDARLCHDGTCDAPDAEPCVDPPEGRCAGSVVRACIAGQARSVDCAAKGLTCAMGREGAECVLPIPEELRCSRPPRCEGEALIACEAGRVVRTECEAQRARCLTLAGDAYPSCVRVESVAPDALGCGPCGCPVDPAARERSCDGRDDDGDGLVDEERDCGPVPVVAFIVTDAQGQSSHSAEDVEAELARVNALYGRTSVPAPPSFVLADLVWLSDASLLEIDEKEVSALADDLRLHPAREAFYVPLVFTDALTLGSGAPKLGVSTLPNGTCGGVQQSLGPEVGVVIVQKSRVPTTVAHELGHFFGLCHTHDELAATRVAVRDDRALLVACQASCRDEGDGICDTPLDPGPVACPYDSTCSAHCAAGDEPDVRNVMSYYTECRAHLTDEQIRLVQHTIALRRGWHACGGLKCACRLGASDCPVGMSCRAYEVPGAEGMLACGLDGPLSPGDDCRNTHECGHGALCLTDQASQRSRCVRPCLDSAEGCTCVSGGPELHVCVEDLR